MMDRAALVALSAMSFDEFESAIFGEIIVDRSGLIERYNQVESNLSHLSADRVIGKNFFKHVAPCTGVRAFEGRFCDFITSNNVAFEGFTYFFPFSHGIVVERVAGSRGSSIKDVSATRADSEGAALAHDTRPGAPHVPAAHVSYARLTPGGSV